MQPCPWHVDFTASPSEIRLTHFLLCAQHCAHGRDTLVCLVPQKVRTEGKVRMDGDFVSLVRRGRSSKIKQLPTCDKGKRWELLWAPALYTGLGLQGRWDLCDLPGAWSVKVAGSKSYQGISYTKMVSILRIPIKASCLLNFSFSTWTMYLFPPPSQNFLFEHVPLFPPQIFYLFLTYLFWEFSCFCFLRETTVFSF